MRMWMIPPQWMCMKHLLGEHGEIHKHRHNFEKQHSIAGRVKEGEVQIEPMAMQVRHDMLEYEIRRRNSKSKCDSPYEMPDLSYLPESHRLARVDVAKNVIELWRKCKDCRKMLAYYGCDVVNKQTSGV